MQVRRNHARVRVAATRHAQVLFEGVPTHPNASRLWKVRAESRCRAFIRRVGNAYINRRRALMRRAPCRRDKGEIRRRQVEAAAAARLRAMSPRVSASAIKLLLEARARQLTVAACVCVGLTNYLDACTAARPTGP